MSAARMGGAAVAGRLRDEVRSAAKQLGDVGVVPGLATVMVGEDYRAAAYERRLAAEAAGLGLAYRHLRLVSEVDLATVAAVLGDLGADAGVDGILVLRPLPPHLDEDVIFATLDPREDVEGVHPENVGLLALGKRRFVPSTAAAAFHLLDCWLAERDPDPVARYRRSVIVVGRSPNVGRPAVALALARDAAVVSVDVHADRAGRLAELAQVAEIVVVAAGRAGLIRAEHVKKESAIVVDIGINLRRDRATGRIRFVGDVDAESVAPVAAALTPVPGGVGPVTDLWLLRNVTAAAEGRAG